VMAVYRYVMRRSLQRPDFGMPLPDPRHDEMFEGFTPPSAELLNGQARAHLGVPPTVRSRA